MLLIGMGLRTRSLVASQIPQVKRVIRSVDIERCERLARKIGSFDSERQVLNYLRDEVRDSRVGDELVGESSRIRQVKTLIAQVARTNATVLVEGETGTGKELVARAVHSGSGRADMAFVKVNCATLPSTLIESELFGHVKGAFTDARQAKKGLFEAAHGGTLFLDEVGETSPPMQVKLLRVLQERRIRRLGGTEETDVDVRVIGATNGPLEDLVRE